SGVIEEQVAIEGAGSVVTYSSIHHSRGSAAVVEDGVYQAVFQRMVDGKLPEPGSLETQSPFAKLLKCYYDTGRITKWEDVRELDIRVMKRVGVNYCATTAATTGGVVDRGVGPVVLGLAVP